MRAPPRLKDDPTVADGMRDALLQEEEILDDYDLAGLREKVVGGAPAAPTPLPRLARWLAVIAVSGFTAAMVTVWLQPDVAPAIAPVSTSAIEPVATFGDRLPARLVTPVSAEDPAVVPVAAVPVLSPEPVPSQPSVRPTADLPEPSPVEPAAVEPTVVPPARVPASQVPAPAVPAPSGLAAELAAYNRGVDAADRGDWRAARDAYTSYLQQFPQGQLSTEGWLGLLTATVEASSPAAAEALASQMLQRGGLGSRRLDVLLVQAEALVELGSCDQALSLVEEIRRNERVNSIKQTCKRARRSD